MIIVTVGRGTHLVASCCTQGLGRVVSKSRLVGTAATTTFLGKTRSAAGSGGTKLVLAWVGDLAKMAAL
jgi:hypothetical protein